MRKPALKPGAAAREELLERRITDLENRIRSIQVRSTSTPSSNTVTVINQTTHGFAAGDVVRYTAGAWAKSKADTEANAIVGGMVLIVYSPDVFVLCGGGRMTGLTGLTAGSVHYLSATTAGALTTTAPAIPVPVILGDSTTSGILLSMAAGRAFALTPYWMSGAASALTSGSSTISTSGKTLMWCVGIGGGGGGAQLEADATSGYIASTSGGSPTKAITIPGRRSGGGGGGLFEAMINVSGLSTVSYSIGAAGTNSAGVGNGTSGGNTSLTVSSDTLTAYGGTSGGYITSGLAAPGGSAALVASSPAAGRVLYLSERQGSPGIRSCMFLKDSGFTGYHGGHAGIPSGPSDNSASAVLAGTGGSVDLSEAPGAGVLFYLLF